MIVRHLAKASGSALCDLHEKYNAFDGKNNNMQYIATIWRYICFWYINYTQCYQKTYMSIFATEFEIPIILLAAVLQGNVMDQPNIHTSNIKSVINLVN